MVAYATPDDVRSVVARDQDRPEQTAAVMDDNQLEASVANAQAEVDAKLRNRYTVPFSPCPEMVRWITVDIAAYLSTVNYRQEEEDLQPTDPVALRYARALALLKCIQDGDADLDDGAGGSADDGGGFGMPVAPSGARLFQAGNFGLGWPGSSWWRDAWWDANV